MKLITRFELATRPTPELQALRRQLFNELACWPPCSLERQNTLASLQNVDLELSCRLDL